MSNLYIVVTSASDMSRQTYASRQTIMADSVSNVSGSEYVFTKDNEEVAWLPAQSVISIVNKGCSTDER